MKWRERDITKKPEREEKWEEKRGIGVERGEGFRVKRRREVGIEKNR